MFDIVLKILLLLTPLAYKPGMDLQKFDLVVFYFGVGALITAAMLGKPLRDADLKPLGALIGLVALNLFLHDFNTIILSAFINLMLFGIAVYLVARHTQDRRGCMKWMLLAACLNLLVLGAQKAGYSPIIENDIEHGGILGNAPVFAMYLTIIMGGFSAWIMLPIAIVCFFMKELVPVGLFGLVVFSASFEEGKAPAGPIMLASACIAAALFFMWPAITHALSIRWVIWGPTIEQMFKSPVRGLGVGIFPHIANQIITTGYDIDTAFSSLVELAFGAGFVGTVAWLIYSIRYYIKNFDWKWEDTIVFFIAVLCILEYPFEVPKLWITLSALIGFYFIKNVKEGQDA